VYGVSESEREGARVRGPWATKGCRVMGGGENVFCAE
jgi:hypothetical protein